MEKHKQTWSRAPTINDEPSASTGATNTATLPAPPPVQVYVRTRPLLEPELSQGHYSLINVQKPDHVHLVYPSMRWGGARFATKTFHTDGVFDQDVSSGDVYESMKVRDHVVRCIEESGRSFTVMAYGQTGSGKTYTMTAIEGTLHLHIYLRL
jgi:kinesin family protein 2/24